MKYFLVIGIEYKFFQKPADITIHVGDKFIDTFQLDRDFLTVKTLPHIESKWYEKFGTKHWLTRDVWIEEWNRLPVLYKVYEMEDSVLEGKLQIKVVNSYSDYTNGFMKNSSVIKFPIVSIIKKDFTQNRGEKFMERLVQLDDAVDEQRNKSGPKLCMYNNRWPCAETFNVQRENEIYEQSEFKTNYWWIGGSFTAEFDIKNRQDTKYIGLCRDNYWMENPRNITTYDMFLASGYPLLNIYDEDQRSNNTKD
jgi:hypothetical protein